MRSIAIDPAGNVIVGGRDHGPACFRAPAPTRPTAAKYEGYVIKFSIGLDTVLGATYLGGSDSDDVRAIALVDPAGGDYTVVAGGATCSSDFTGVSRVRRFDFRCHQCLHHLRARALSRS